MKEFLLKFKFVFVGLLICALTLKLWSISVFAYSSYVPSSDDYLSWENNSSLMRFDYHSGFSNVDYRQIFGSGVTYGVTVTSSGTMYIYTIWVDNDDTVPYYMSIRLSDTSVSVYKKEQAYSFTRDGVKYIYTYSYSSSPGNYMITDPYNQIEGYMNSDRSSIEDQLYNYYVSDIINQGSVDVDKSNLQNLYDIVVGLDLKEENYSVASWSTFNTALNTADSVLRDPYSNQTIVDNAYQALQEALDGLELLSGGQVNLLPIISRLDMIQSTLVDIKGNTGSSSNVGGGLSDDDRLLLKRYDVSLLIIAFAVMLNFIHGLVHQIGRNMRGK